ncbi:hypothetical protein PMIN06_003942 [Paraphaeosphaeria minitans]
MNTRIASNQKKDGQRARAGESAGRDSSFRIIWVNTAPRVIGPLYQLESSFSRRRALLRRRHKPVLQGRIELPNTALRSYGTNCQQHDLKLIHEEQFTQQFATN